MPLGSSSPTATGTFGRTLETPQILQVKSLPFIFPLFVTHRVCGTWLPKQAEFKTIACPYNTDPRWEFLNTTLKSVCQSISSWRFANSYIWFKRKFKRVGRVTSIWQRPDAGRNRGKKKKKREKGKGKGKRGRGKEEGRDEGLSACYWNTRELKNLPQRISAKLIVLLLFVGNATQNDGYFSIGRSSKFDPFLASLYLTFFTDFWSAYFSLQNIIYHASSLKKLFISRKWKLSPYFYWKLAYHCHGNGIHTNCVLSGTTTAQGKLIGSFKRKKTLRPLQNPHHSKIWGEIF